jgi:putative membrane-bound dehydrogenase-like protein
MLAVTRHSFKLLALLLIVSVSSATRAEHGQFDKSEVNRAEEAFIFTPPGFDKPGKPAIASGADTAHLDVTIRDAATGRPTLCRVNVIGADGNYYEPKENSLGQFSLTSTWPESLAGNRPSKAPIRYFGHFFYTNGQFTVDVPAGKVRIEVWKGFEYRPAVLTSKVSAGASPKLQLSIARRADVAREGWYSGDMHLHFDRTSDADEKIIYDLMEAEDIRFGNILCYNENTSGYRGMMPEQVAPQRRGLGAKSIARRGDYHIISGQEYRNGVFGHLNLYLRDRLVLEGRELDPNVGPLFGTIGAETQAHGGYAFHAHGGYALEIWADLVQRATNGVELLQFGIYRGIGLDGWYHVLGAGFRFPGYGASDYPACRKLGDCRTYVHIAGQPNFVDWLRGAAEGRSFMTSGPLLLLDVDGHLPGDTITTRDGRPRTVRARVRVMTEESPVTDVQLVVNGRVVETLKAERRPGQSQRLEMTVPVVLNESSWIAACAFSKSPSGNADAEAHTNPVYVHLDGKPPFHAADVDWLIARIDEQIADHEARSAVEKSMPIDYFRRSRAILEEMKAKGAAVATVAAPPAPTSPQPAAAQIKPPGTPVEQSLAEFLKPVPAKSPKEAERLFDTLHGFRMELVAHEPDVTDPVAACFDENGGMYVAEMIDYPYRPKEGAKPLGRVRYLQDKDEDGRYETSSIFADELAWPTGVVCWKGGVYVAAAPDVWYLKDEDGDGCADVRTKVFTGFGDRNQQGGVNNLAWHVDHTIYGSASTNGGDVRPADTPDATPIVLSDRDFRFDPVSGRFETISGSRQFGNAFDDWFNRFLCSESEPCYHVVLPQHYLARNPHLAVPTALNDLCQGVTKIFRTSPIEAWRQVRSGRRLALGERSPDSAGLSHNVIDAGAGLQVYRGHAYPSEYRGDSFIGCSQNNLVHRRKLTQDGATFRSERADPDAEFVRTVDTWFRPVNTINAPDGTLYILDMSREVIESIHIAHDVVAHLDLTSGRDKGRIYRLAPPGFKAPPQPKLGNATTAELAGHLEHPSGWWRDTASRLIYERQDRSIVPLLRKRLTESPFDVGRMHILWALEGLDAIAEADLLAGLADASAGVREHALRLAESRLEKHPALVEKVLALADDPVARVRFQAAFTLGDTDDPRAVEALARIARRDGGDHWMRTAVLSSCATKADQLAAALLKDPSFLALPTANVWLDDLATIVGAREQNDEVAWVLDSAAALPAASPAPLAVVLGLGKGLQRGGHTLETIHPALSGDSAALVDRLMREADSSARDSQAAADARRQAVQLLGYSGADTTPDTMLEMIVTGEDESVQLAALAVLGRHREERIAERLASVCRNETPRVQSEIITLLASRREWIGPLLAACERGDVTSGLIPQPTQTELLKSDDEAIRQRAERLFGAASPRAEVIARYSAATELTADAAHGNAVFERECVACHRLGERGNEVGPNLALVRNRTPEAMVEAILDPNRNVAPNYVSYVVVDDSGRSTTGLVTSETATSITLARDKGVTETIQKQNIEAMKSTGTSLMPEGLEKTIDPQSMADLLAFLQSVQYDIGTLPDFAEPKK